MVNKRKIVTMIHMAIYEKHQGNEDYKVNEYFRYDYVSRKNLPNIFLVLIFTTISVLIYRINNIYNDDLVFDYNVLKTQMVNSLWFIFLIVMIYTAIGFIIYYAEYSQKERRQKMFKAHLKTLDEN